MGWVYVDYWPAHQLTKIGHTQRHDHNKRLTELQRGCTTCRGLQPSGIRRMHQIRTPEHRRVEQRAQALLEVRYGAGGEWFHCPPHVAVAAVHKAAEAHGHSEWWWAATETKVDIVAAVHRARRVIELGLMGAGAVTVVGVSGWAALAVG